MSIRFDDQVAIVTGAGGGLGRSHALELGKRGAKVLVNDRGSDVHGKGGSVSAAQQVAETIQATGGKAIAHPADVCDADDVADMVETAMSRWGRIDVLVNNAGVLRDKSFAKMQLADFEFVTRVHLLGSMICTSAVWSIMREQTYGRIVFTSSSSGLYGNFGQSNYSAAKMGVIGLMNTLCLEGAKYDIRVNALAPTAGTRMTEGLMPEDVHALLTPAAVTAGLITLCDENAPNRTILCAGAGSYAATKIFETDGVYLPPEAQTPENVRSAWQQILETSNMQELVQGGQQTQRFVEKAIAGP